MTRFDPFIALRYTTATSSDLSAVVAPPYDVLSDDDRNALEQRDAHNSVRLDYPHGKTDSTAYVGARVTRDAWLAAGVLAADQQPTLTIYRMTDPASSRVTTGVFGALGLEHPGVGDVLPHEETMSKDKADRLSLIRETLINTSPIWVLATTSGLGQMCSDIANAHSADAHATDLDGVLHEVWTVTSTAQITALCELVRNGPVVVADGHHRLETALTFETERPTANAILSFVVELSPEELDVRPIHRIIELGSLSDVSAAVAAFDAHFERAPLDNNATSNPNGLILIHPSGERELLTPKAEAFDATINLDSQRIREALRDVPNLTTRFHHDVGTVSRASLDSGGRCFGVLLRPATVGQIREVADARTRMPPKTTFFFPKPRTGLVFRPVDAQAL